MSENYRIGQGIDVHKFADTIDKKKPLKLAGIEVSEEYSLIAHSDGDVVLHAICDAILGAASKGDIGYHFPNTDMKWKNVDSSKFVIFCRKKLMKKVAVIGAGISGLFIANLFKRNEKYQVTIFERNSLIDLKEGYGIQLSVNSVKLLNKIQFNTLENNERFIR